MPKVDDVAKRSMSAKAFHEKAGRSQVDSVLASWNIVVLFAE